MEIIKNGNKKAFEIYEKIYGNYLYNLVNEIGKLYNNTKKHYETVINIDLDNVEFKILTDTDLFKLNVSPSAIALNDISINEYILNQVRDFINEIEKGEFKK